MKRYVWDKVRSRKHHVGSASTFVLAAQNMPNVEVFEMTSAEIERRNEKMCKFRRSCRYIFDGPLAEKDENMKVQYLMLWVGEEGRQLRRMGTVSGKEESVNASQERF